jgi:hypothetical protein
LGGTPTAPTVTVTGTNFGATAPTGTPESCQGGDTGNDYANNALYFQDSTENWGAGGTGNCIGLVVSSWSATQVVFTIGSEYANYGPIKTGDQIEAVVKGASDSVAASFS